MVSQQQASVIGKVILNFQNVTSQFNRLGKKAFALINIDDKRHEFTYFNDDKVVSFDFKPDYPKVVDENNYFTFLADNIHEKTTDENLLEGELSR